MSNISLFYKITGIIILLFYLNACGDADQSETAIPTVTTGIQEDGCLPEAMMQRLVIEEAITGPLKRSLSLPGNIEVNKDRVFRVMPTAGGIITDVHVRTGDRVNRGQVLATIQSPDIAAFKRDIRAAKAEKNMAEQNLDLARSMFESGVYSRRDLLQAESELEKINSEIDRLREEQKVLGIEEGQTAYTIRAPQSGFIVERNINPGTALNSGDGHAFKISDLRDVWVIANVSETDIGNIRVGDTVSIQTLAFQDRIFEGRIVRMSNTIDPNRRTMEAVIELPNPDFLLKPGMFANIDLNASENEIYNSIPSRALIFDNNEYFVVVIEDACNVEIRKVEIKRRNGERTYLTSGVEAGESVISNRHILVYNQLLASQ